MSDRFSALLREAMKRDARIRRYVDVENNAALVPENEFSPVRYELDTARPRFNNIGFNDDHDCNCNNRGPRNASVDLFDVDAAPTEDIGVSDFD